MRSYRTDSDIQNTSKNRWIIKMVPVASDVDEEFGLEIEVC